MYFRKRLASRQTRVLRCSKREVFGSFSDVAQIVRRQHVLLASFLEKSVKCAAECVQMFPLSSRAAAVEAVAAAEQQSFSQTARGQSSLLLHSWTGVWELKKVTFRGRVNEKEAGKKGRKIAGIKSEKQM